ncbi:hypothetical protein COLO4_24176 [Corchorus olitorius]|uniref:Uncharacterized protein n=1 Tax=Corchorus olitorius TaxID=93759 RepID=A0A1R3IC90_9ROSI|nr:hypothetical protein COLO4_24176 [Corchorus olitorius]
MALAQTLLACHERVPISSDNLSSSVKILST